MALRTFHINTPAWAGIDNFLGKHNAVSADWSDMGRGEHFVQFYESDEYLDMSIAEYFVHGLRSGETCIIAARADRISRLEKLLDLYGIDVQKHRRDNTYFPLDAPETLERFMDGKSPDPALFDAVIGELVSSKVANTKVRIFGEMVAVLWEQGNQPAAIELERLWCGLSERFNFSLFCGYPLSGFDGRDAGPAMKMVCDSHTNVIPSESYTGLATNKARLREIAYLQQRSRQLEAELLEMRSAGHVMDAA